MCFYHLVIPGQKADWKNKIVYKDKDGRVATRWCVSSQGTPKQADQGSKVDSLRLHCMKDYICISNLWWWTVSKIQIGKKRRKKELSGTVVKIHTPNANTYTNLAYRGPLLNTSVCYCKYLVSQSHGNNTVQLGL